MYEELVERLNSLREDYFQTQDDDNFCFSAVDADMLENAAETIVQLSSMNQAKLDTIHDLQSELEQVKAEREALLKEKAEREKECELCNDKAMKQYAISLGHQYCARCGRKMVSEE